MRLIKKQSLIFLLGIFIIAVMMPAAILAQSSPVIITLAIPDFYSDLFTENILSQFEAENPGIKVNLRKSGQDGFFSPAAGDIDGHFEDAATYAASADVLYVNQNSLTVEATRSGYFLDLTPLISADTNLNVDDFLPAVWRSYQWDGGRWAIPAAASVYILAYQPEKFDELGLPYPSSAWTIDDFANAANALAERDAAGNVTRPGFVNLGDNALIVRAFLGQGLYDDTIIPNPPVFNNPSLEPLLTKVAELNKDGVIGGTANLGTYDLEEVPMRLDQTYILSDLLNSGQNWQGTLLPGNIAGLSVDGFAISSGTQYPEQAYALIKFLTEKAEVVNRFFSDTPARQSLVGQDSESPNQLLRNFDPTDQALVEDAIAVAIPVSELRYGNYLVNAVAKINEGIDVRTALQEAEQQIIENLQKAEAQRDTTVVYVATPVPTPVLGASEVSIKFGLTSFFTPLPNREAWDQAIADFTAADSQVGQIVFDSGFDSAIGDLTSKYDCFYVPFNLVQNSDDLSPLLNLDPFMSVDASFDSADVVGNTLQQLQKDNKTWGIPITIQPEILKYESELFAQAGVVPPENGWTTDQFNTALQLLKANMTDEDEAPFVPSGFGGTYLLVLMSAFGGIPLDYRTTPPTINYTDTNTITAIRQVLDLAKDGYIRYSELGNFGGLNFGFGGPEIRPIYPETLNGASLFQTGEEDNTETPADPYRVTLYPQGSQYTGISYDIGAGYISATAQNAEACYRWLSTLAGRPDLFGAMPARRSLINDPAITAVQGEDTTAAYNLMDTLLASPSTIAFPSAFGGASSPGNFIMQIWLYRAFDNYVLEDGDLQAKLEEAQIFSEAYQGCIATIPPYNLPPGATQSEQLNYFRQFIDCAVDIDPSLSSLFSFLGSS